MELSLFLFQGDGFFSHQLNIISFAVADLIAGDSLSCPRKVLSVSNFTEQVVSGYKYTFDLVLKTVNVSIIAENKLIVNFYYDVPKYYLNL